MRQRIMELPEPLSLRRTFGSLHQGRLDPCTRWHGDAFWRATRTPDGPVTSLLEVFGDRLRMSAWGPGAGWAVSMADRLVGTAQHHGFGHQMLDDLNRRQHGLRTPRTEAVFEALTFTVLAQRVTGGEAVYAYKQLTHHVSEPAPAAPGAPPLLLPPSPEQVAGLPSWAFHRFGVERHRAETLVRAARCARRLEEAVGMTPATAFERLTALPGLGEWTAAEVSQIALGNADAVSVGDFHLKNQVAWALAGEPRGSDERMLELLQPFSGRRGHAVRLIARGHPSPPKFGPRYRPVPIANM